MGATLGDSWEMATTQQGRRTIWVFGDQLNRSMGPLRESSPEEDLILMIESREHLERRPWHRQRAHLIVTSMRRFAQSLERDGFVVDYRSAPTYRAGLAAHRKERQPSTVIAMAPSSHSGRLFVASLGVALESDERFLTSVEEFDDLFAGKKRVTMETFYRWQRRRLGYLMDGDEPATGRWNYDEENRQRLPKSGVEFPEPVVDEPDDLDRDVLEELPASLVGAVPVGLWPTSRDAALARLRHAIDHVLPQFGPYEDAMTTKSWHLAHTLLSPALNLGLLHPREVANAIEEAYRAGDVPIASAEGLLRQIIGWREFVWCLYWSQGTAYLETNELDAHRPLPPLFATASTQMNCMGHVLADVDAYGWTHHIPRLMVLGNLALLAGIEPQSLMDWMWERFVDGAEWVMAPNVLGMALYADGGVMATKPYAAGGAYIDKMSDFCKDCSFDRKLRTGDRACPFTTLYWDFIARHAERFARNPRMARQAAAARKLGDLEEVRTRARHVLDQLDRGEL
jgi:deoxyribodipyrimidine photolyase-related protein